MRKLTFQTLWARRGRLVSTSVAVVLGVAFVVGTLVLGDTIAANFNRLFSDTAAGTDVVVRAKSPLDSSFEADPGRRPIDAGLVETVATIDGVVVAEPQIVGYGQLLGADGDPVGGNGPPRLAGSWTTTPELNAYRLAEGRAPQAADEVVVNRGAAKAGDLAIGDRTIVQLPRPVEVEIVGISTFGDADGFGEVTMTSFTFEAARELMMRDPGTVSSILVRADGGEDAETVSGRIAAVLPAGIEAVTGDELVDERLESLSALDVFRAVLVAFALVAVVVAALGVNNAFSITLVQRSRELALLRTIGASSRQVRSMVRLEAVVIGLVGSAIGVIGGLGLAQVLKGVFAGFGLALPTGGMTVDRSAVVIGIVVGVASTMLAARVPARRAGRVAPIEAFRAAAADVRPPSRRRRIATAVILVTGGVLVAVGTGGGAAQLVGLGALCLVVGMLLLAPEAVPLFARTTGWLLRPVWRLSADLAEQNALRHPQRTAKTAAALLIGATVVTTFTVIAASMARDTRDEADGGFGNADLAIVTPAFGGGVIDSDAVADLDGIAELDDAVGVALMTVVHDGGETGAAATDLGRAADVLALKVLEGGLDTVGPDDIVASRSLADEEGWTVGSSTEITYLDGATARVTVRAIIDDTALLAGIVVPVEAWFAHTQVPAYANVFLTLAPGVDLDAGRSAIADVANRYSGDVQDREEFSEAATGGIDMLLGLIYVMLALAIVISLLGIANTLSMAVHERQREIGLLRALGQTRRQTRAVLRLESVIVATFGTSVGMLLGAVVGSALFVAISDAGTTVPWSRLAVILVAGGVAGVVAALRPSRRAARLDVLDAIAQP